MKLLTQRYFGLIARCNSCGALLGYEPNDVDKEQHIKCPQCGFTIWVPFNPNYEGVIEDNGDNRLEQENSAG